MTTQQIKAAATRLVDFAGEAGGSQLVQDIATNGYTGEIDFVALVGDTVDDATEQAVREACRVEAARALA